MNLVEKVILLNHWHPSQDLISAESQLLVHWMMKREGLRTGFYRANREICSTWAFIST
jgi:hypothetical protein